MLVACGPVGMNDVPTPRVSWPGAESRCGESGRRATPLVVDWPAADRGSLERQLSRGLVVVRHAGCELRVLSECRVAEGRYRYGGFTTKTQEVRIRNTHELYANLPVGAARLEGRLAHADALTVEMTMVGMYEALDTDWGIDELEGECGEATHLIAGVQVGAYAFSAERSIDGGAGGGMLVGPSIGASGGRLREILSRDGDHARCERATVDDLRPPEGCGALLRLEIVPLGEERLSAVSCPEGTAWDGLQCATPSPLGKLAGRSPVERPIPGSISGPSSGPVGAGPHCPSGMHLVPGGVLEGETVASFCLDVTEVTAGDFEACVRAGGCESPSSVAWWPGIEEVEQRMGTELCNHPAGRFTHPMNCVSWEEARTHCRWRSADLPTELQWTWAARGGTDARPFPWGSLPVTPARVNACGTECRAWFERRGRRRDRVAYERADPWPATAPVGSHPAGAGRWGTMDLAGNVAEWVADRADRRGHRRVRGGSFWVQRPAWLSKDDLASARAERRDAVLGFRCAAAPSLASDSET